MRLTPDSSVFMGAARRHDPGEKVSDSRFAILGVPMDWTQCFRPGSRFGPGAIRLASWSLEEYSPRLGRSLEEFVYEDWGDMDLPPGSAERSLEMVERTTQEIVELGMRPMLIGGEHLLTLGVLKALSARQRDIVLVYIDAHADLRDEYGGERYSHATVLRRIAEEVTGVTSIFAVGARSFSREEWCVMAEVRVFRCEGRDLVESAKRAAEAARNRPVYLSIDVDIVDPAFAPGVGCPEPGGPSSIELLEGLRAFKGLRIVGADVVEVSPPYDPSGATAVLASMLVREMLIMFSEDINRRY